VSFKGQKNTYTCRGCGFRIVTIDVDEGVTPMMLGCRSGTKCRGTMMSSMYRPPDPEAPPTHEWYKPAPAEMVAKLLSREWGHGTAAHVAQGGLMLRGRQ
jgi:hypothetical protein